jgi:type VI secretion system protein ImpJ
LVNALNTAHATLNHLLQYPQIHPERLFFELLRLTGSLLTFSTQYEVDHLPRYQHHRLQESFSNSLMAFYVNSLIRLFQVVISVLH